MVTGWDFLPDFFPPSTEMEIDKDWAKATSLEFWSVSGSKEWTGGGVFSRVLGGCNLGVTFLIGKWDCLTHGKTLYTTRVGKPSTCRWCTS